jgi:hypothetical protein
MGELYPEETQQTRYEQLFPEPVKQDGFPEGEATPRDLDQTLALVQQEFVQHSQPRQPELAESQFPQPERAPPEQVNRGGFPEEAVAPQGLGQSLGPEQQ